MQSLENLYKNNKLKTILILSSFLFFTSLKSETIKTVNDVNIDSMILDIYIQNRTQQQPSQITADQRLLFLEELTDVYLLSTQDDAIELNKDPSIKAQIELQNRMLIAQASANKFFSSINISEEDILNNYNNMIQNNPQNEYKASHILVESQSEAISIIEKLNSGEQFSFKALSISLEVDSSI